MILFEHIILTWENYSCRVQLLFCDFSTFQTNDNQTHPKPLTMQEIEMETAVPRSTAPGIIRNSKAAACEDKDNSDPDPTAMANLMPKLKSGRPRKFNDTQRAEVVAMATQDTITTLLRKMREVYK
ncbi:hypothetical protein L873DRAFT_1846751 [Choiromyces venosus 120613-1]|uniref:Uncharacterized protein n=1 Tax=Choiromyces venosus 120613-1 TaxID=1336337 RepID=A0A3N4JJR3_9PEZI|nr:hypothetical protein L873DRAFT_1846751 [Choiromyces venosus 120613-1]